MCIICVELAKAMTVDEARRALREMRDSLDDAHVAEIETKLVEAEAEAKAKP